MIRRIITCFFLVLTLHLPAQDGAFVVTEESYADTSVEMADVMRSNGKIYVVVGAIMIIFVGLAVYTITIDRKVKKMEDEVFGEKSNS